ncbi:hypothetical protein GCM10023205_78950 [Yinghuangia aomiensis]|uniref:Methyltransferase domain-containing protein n=1 Tax=Yinghuangia aomiensis TaxID=676205 RepID=A0ABP9IC25_9ACTN
MTSILTITGALRTARTYCPPVCFPYHATWRLFRSTGLKGHPGWHRGFYRLALDRTGLTHRPRLRVLICGASDEAMLATLADLLGIDRLDVYLVDRCATPLRLALAYANHVDLALVTRQAEAPQLPDFGARFDLVITDGLLSLLPSDAVRATVFALAGALREDGVLAYTARVAQPSRSRLEYDRPGRWIQAAAVLAAYPGPPGQRASHAVNVLQRPSRTSPFTTSEHLRDAFADAFSDTAVYINDGPASCAQRLHPAHCAGATSLRVGVLAQHPRRPGSKT